MADNDALDPNDPLFESRVVVVPYVEGRTQDEIDADTTAAHDRCIVLLEKAVTTLLEARLEILRGCTGEGWTDLAREIDGFVRPIALRIEVQRRGARQ